MLWELPGDASKTPALIELARQARSLRPDQAKPWESLGRLLLRAGQDEEAVEVLTEAAARLPREPKLHLMLADACYRAGRSDRFREVLEKAPAVPQTDRDMRIFHLELWMKARGEEAERAASEALAIDPAHPEALKVLAGRSRQRGEVERMIPLCRSALEIDPRHTLARYELAVAYALTGRPDEARALIDLQQFVQLKDLAAPEGYADAADFEAALVEEIKRNPTLKADPVGKATKNGFQTGGLPQAGERAIPALLDAIRGAVDAIEIQLAESSREAFVEKRPARARLRAWAVVVPGEGRQVAHIHPDGWLSGVYYVRAPEVIRGEARAGCLVLGSLEVAGKGVEPPWGTRDIKPEPGRMVVFPSYIPHATLPTNAPGERICISFDVIPSARDDAAGD